MSSNGRDHDGQLRAPSREAMLGQLPKRFYTAVSTEERKPGHWAILLDGRAVRTPRKSDLAMPNDDLATAIALEWRTQGERIDPATMPLTRLANSVLDGVRGREAEVRADIVAYAGNDMLCYRAERPEGLVAKQQAHWDPILAWAARRIGTAFVTQRGLMPVAQPVAIAPDFEALIAQLDAFRLGALHVMTTLTGSALLPFAVLEDRLELEAAWSAAHVDEDWQIAEWGADAEAQARRASRWSDMQAAGRMLALVTP